MKQKHFHNEYDVDKAVSYHHRKRRDLKEWNNWSIKEVANFERVLLICDSRDFQEVAEKMKTKKTSEVLFTELNMAYIIYITTYNQ